MRLPSTLPSNVTIYRPSEFWNSSAGHPDASECRLKDFDDCSEPPDFIAGRRQDRRMKDNVLIEGSYCSGKIAGFQCGREDSLCHCCGSRAPHECAFTNGIQQSQESDIGKVT
jgi:hypothetical protein